MTETKMCLNEKVSSGLKLAGSDAGGVADLLFPESCHL